MNKIFLFIIVILCVGCSNIDPIYKKRSWNSLDSNRRNLIVQVDSSGDLILGRNKEEYDGSLSIDAVKRLVSGKVKGIDKVKTSSASSGESSGSN